MPRCGRSALRIGGRLGARDFVVTLGSCTLKCGSNLAVLMHPIEQTVLRLVEHPDLGSIGALTTKILNN